MLDLHHQKTAPTHPLTHRPSASWSLGAAWAIGDALLRHGEVRQLVAKFGFITCINSADTIWRNISLLQEGDQDFLCIKIYFLMVALPSKYILWRWIPLALNCIVPTPVFAAWLFPEIKKGNLSKDWNILVFFFVSYSVKFDSVFSTIKFCGKFLCRHVLRGADGNVAFFVFWRGTILFS
jgi:hypothetical protein